ncbi:lasso RiPP family leader peptide-containing protein [Myceligenerans crystallogenes]|uniref:Lasso RiPP family leader peptide-containing protein n=1 Tax=Myceligenerans crystallogenes TaxID=316335 RepID=A0ABN2NQG6_9MICO
MENVTTREAHEPVESPVVTELGSLTELTLGSGANDTADMKQYYY